MRDMHCAHLQTRAYRRFMQNHCTVARKQSAKDSRRPGQRFERNHARLGRPLTDSQGELPAIRADIDHRRQITSQNLPMLGTGEDVWI